MAYIPLGDPELGETEPCSYLADQQHRFEYQGIAQMDEASFDTYLSQGWRRFGYTFFRPACQACQACQPIRIPTAAFDPGKNLRRVQKKNADTQVRVCDLAFRDEIYDVYVDHSQSRFERASDIQAFASAHYTPTTPALQVEYHRDNRLVAVGFVDVSLRGWSSAYFIYRSGYEALSLGTFGAIAEIRAAQDAGKDYYYLGYYIRDNHFMAYKARFRPHEIYDWGQKIWKPAPDLG